MSRHGFAPLLLAALCGLGVSVTRDLRAQNPAAAEALFEQARAAMAAGSFDIACARFRDSDKLDPAVGTRFNLADCEERRGRVATAWSLFRGVVSELAQDDDRRPIAERRAQALGPRMPYVTMVRVADTPPNVRVRIDGVELGDGSFGIPLPMDPGAHDLMLVTRQAGQQQSSTFVLREGQHTELPIHFSVRAAPAAQAAPSSTVAATSDEPTAATEEPSARRRWGYIVGGVGVAGLSFSAVTGIITLGKKSTAKANCSDDTHTCNQAGVDANKSGATFGRLSGVGLGVGLVGLVAGAYLLLTAPPETPQAAHSSLPARARVSVNPALSLDRGTGFLAVRGSF